MLFAVDALSTGVTATFVFGCCPKNALAGWVAVQWVFDEAIVGH